MVKSHFPMFAADPDLAYWDTAASGLKLGVALDDEYYFLKHRYANVHRGVYKLSAAASLDYEEARAYLADYFVCDKEGFVFVRGATEGINLFASSVIEPGLKSGDNIIISQSEHHANILVWKELCRRYACELKVVKLNDDFRVDLNHLYELMDDRTVLIAMTHASNVTGAVNDLSWVSKARSQGIWTLIDGAQMASHHAVDMNALGVDAYAVSAHKFYGPCGIGAVMLSQRARDVARPYQRGGGMVGKIFAESESFQADPHRFEAGTPHISGAIGFASACRYLAEHRRAILERERTVFAYLLKRWRLCMNNVPTWTDPSGIGIIAFNVPGVHPHDLATLCDHHHVALRAGHHCASPLMASWGQSSVARISVGAYNDVQDVDRLMGVLKLSLERDDVE